MTIKKRSLSDSSRLSYEQILLHAIMQCLDARNNDNPTLYRITIETLALFAKRNDAFHNDTPLKETIGNYEKNKLLSKEEMDRIVKEGNKNMHDVIMETYDRFLAFILDEMEAAGLLAYKKMVQYGSEYE